MKLRTVFISIALLALYGTGLSLRRAVVETATKALAAPVPFSLESAIRYRRVKMVYDTGGMPAVDAFIQAPDGINVRETYEFGSEYVEAALAKVLPSIIPVAERFRWVEAGWFCLGIPLLALWIAAWTGRWTAGLTAAAFYAVSFASVSRSTGLELANENYALPLFIGHLALGAVSAAATVRGRRLAAAMASAFLLAWSLWWWDLIQYAVMLWAVAVLVREWRRREPMEEGELLRLVLNSAALFFVGAVSPYYRAHAFLASPAMSCVTATLLLVGVDAWCRVRSGQSLRDRLAVRFTASGRAAAVVAIILVPFALVSLVHAFAGYQSSYGHFVELLWAKFRYLNHKPSNPALLTFDQRIMWVPALNSADALLTLSLFPAIVPLSFVAVFVVFPLVRKRSIPRLAQLFFFYVSSLLAYWFFARFQVFLSLFAAASLGVWVGLVQPGGWKAWVSRVLLGFGFLIESANTVDAVRDPERSGRPNVYYKELTELASWLSAHVSPEPVLANFGVSGFIAAYGKCPIVLHPKFEDGLLREQVREYAEELFKGSERSFRDWADAHGARYYVYSMGEFAKISPELQLRYMVDAMNPATNAPARLFESNPGKLTLFHRVWGDRKYAVYEIFSRAEEREAASHAVTAAKALEGGNVAGARVEAEASLKIDPNQDQARRVLVHVMALEEKGFAPGGKHEPRP